MYQAEAVTKTVGLSQTTILSTVEYFIYLPCYEVGVLENHLIVIRTWKKNGAIQKLLFEEKYSGEPLKSFWFTDICCLF